MRDSRRFCYRLGADAVELDVEGVKLLFGVNVHGPAFDLAVSTDTGNSDLADAGDIVTGRLNI